MRFAARHLTFVLAASVAGGACSSGTGDDDRPVDPDVAITTTIAAPTTTTAPPSSTTTTTTVVSTTVVAPGPDDDPVEALRAFWDLFVEVGGQPGPFDPQVVRSRLAERTTGEQLSTLFQLFQGNAAAGYVVRGEIDIAPTVLSNDGSTAVLRDCYDDRTGIYRAFDDVRIDSDDPARHQVLVTLLREDGTWKVASTVSEGVGCDA